MRKDTVSNDRKMAEAQKLSEMLEKAKAINPQLTQGYIANEFGLTQGLVGQWLSGKTNIPDKRLIALSEILDFDPVEIRPELKGYRKTGSISPDSPLYDLAQQCRELGLQAQAESILRSLLEAHQAKK